jgi:hypothetical protein
MMSGRDSQSKLRICWNARGELSLSGHASVPPSTCGVYERQRTYLSTDAGLMIYPTSGAKFANPVAGV